MSVRKAIAWASASKLLSFSIAFAGSIIVARYFLTPAEVGLFSIAFAATALIAVLQEFGLNRYIVGEAELGKEKLHTAFSVSLAVAWGVALVILAAAKPLSWLYGDPKLFPLMLVIGSSYLFVPLAIVPTALRQRAMDFRSDFMIEVAASVTNAVVTISLAAAGQGPMALAWGALAQQIARALVSQWRNGWIFPWPLRFTGASHVLRFGGGSTLLQIFDSVGTRSPDLIVGGIAGNTAVGLYSRASGLAVQLVNLMTGAVNSVFYPALAQMRNEGKSLGEPYLRLVGGYTGIVWPALAGLAAASYPLVHALYGPRWTDVAPILSLLAIAEMIFVALPMSVQVPILLGRLDGVLKRTGTATAVAVVLLLVGARHGGQAAAAAYVVYAAFWFCLYAVFLRSLTGFAWRGLLADYGRSLIGAAAAVAPLLAWYRWITPPTAMGFAELLVPVSAGVLLWLAALFATSNHLTDDIRRLVVTTLDRIGLRRPASKQPLP
ncbi:MAG: lipopolysaccharide biosynthesis protein [Sphingopyxis sp.]|uniref:lipopolysaccharide biosynthesis protein n=1 Tax=Sphingopyxis sp. TaxID=1908224 RepID=UPI001A48232A|nr:lipopolysaccharide biosynthesis protein [Sphingopyxis sp.]MBL9071896.1 lipopolysaccharide biosynthesis protein [Sphingopyxis sp.]